MKGKTIMEKKNIFVIIFVVIISITIGVGLKAQWDFEKPRAITTGMVVLQKSDSPLRVPKGYIVSGNSEMVTNHTMAGYLFLDMQSETWITKKTEIVRAGSAGCFIYKAYALSDDGHDLDKDGFIDSVYKPPTYPDS